MLQLSCSLCLIFRLVSFVTSRTLDSRAPQLKCTAFASKVDVSQASRLTSPDGPSGAIPKSSQANTSFPLSASIVFTPIISPSDSTWTHVDTFTETSSSSVSSVSDRTLRTAQAECSDESFGNPSMASCMDAVHRIPYDDNQIAVGLRDGGSFNQSIPWRMLSCESSPRRHFDHLS